MQTDYNVQTVLITGSAGFIGFHLSKKLLELGWKVIGLDSLSDYYDVNLKKSREAILKKYDNYISIRQNIEQPSALKPIFREYAPKIVVHLAAQAGVRYSIKNPRAFLESNIIGTFELLEAAREYSPQHMLIASTSSAYGAQTQKPYSETLKADQQMSFYAATKKSTESFSHSYSHLYSLPITMLRFFTVYGPWGRPDMALFKFTKSIIKKEPIEVFNFGKMKRDFTYIDDLVESIFQLFFNAPNLKKQKLYKYDSLSSVAPFRVVNIGNATEVDLNEYIKAIEEVLGQKAKKTFLPMQPGDVPSTLASTDLLYELTNYAPNTPIKKGIKAFVEWYQNYYKP